jgi:hypothetical protein
LIGIRLEFLGAAGAAKIVRLAGMFGFGLSRRWIDCHSADGIFRESGGHEFKKLLTAEIAETSRSAPRKPHDSNHYSESRSRP